MLPAYTNEVVRLTPEILPGFIRADQDKPKASSLLPVHIVLAPQEAMWRSICCGVHARMADDSIGLAWVQIILFTNKNETPALFRALAANGQALGFGFADAHESEQALMKEFNVKKVRQLLVGTSLSQQEVQGGVPLERLHALALCEGRRVASFRQ